MKKRAIIISVAVFMILIGSLVFASKFCTRCERQAVKTSAAYNNGSYLDCLSERRYYSVDSRVYIENCSIRPIKLTKVAFVGDKTGIIKEFVNESNTVEVPPLAFRCFATNSEIISAEGYERPRFLSPPGQAAEGFSFHIEWEADTRVTPPKITTELIKPLLPLYYVPIMPDGSVLYCEGIDQG